MASAPSFCTRLMNGEIVDKTDLRRFASMLPVIGTVMHLYNMNNSYREETRLKDEQLAKIKAGNADAPSAVKARIDRVKSVRSFMSPMHAFSMLGNTILLIVAIATGTLALTATTKFALAITGLLSLPSIYEITQITSDMLAAARDYTRRNYPVY